MPAVQTQNIFYGIGALLLALAITFLAFEFIEKISREVKVIILAALFVGFLFLARHFREGGK